MDSAHEPGELALSMADLDAGFGDYQDALTWLEVYSERERLPRSYEQKRRDWIERLRAGRAGLPPRPLRSP